MNAQAPVNPSTRWFRHPVLLHVLAWGFLFGAPYLLDNFRPGDQLPHIKRTMMPLLGAALVFYCNYFLLLDKLYFRKKLFLFLLINLALYLFVSYGLEALKPATPNEFSPSHDPSMHPPRPEDGHGSFFLFRALLSHIVSLSAATALRATARWNAMQLKAEQLQAEHLQAELSALKLQLSPHFLFNTMNNIYALVEIDSSRARQAIHNLSQLLRHLLYETNAEYVSLNKEVEQIKRYVELMKLRLPAETDVKLEIRLDTIDTHVAPQLWMPLVENAFKHGTSSTQPSHIHVLVQQNARNVVLRIINTNHPKTQEDRSGSGIGLANLERRLQLLYPNRYSFVRKIIEDNTHFAELEIWTEPEAYK